MELQIVLKKTDSTRRCRHTSSCLRLAIMKFMSSSLQNMEIIFLKIQNRYYEDEANYNEINNTWYWWKFSSQLKHKLMIEIYINKWSIRTVSALNHLSIQEIQHFKKHYAVKFNYRQNVEENIKSKQKTRVTQDHLDWITRFIMKKKFWYFTIREIKNFLDNEWTDLESISIWTIHKILTKQLKMRYKRIWKFPKKTTLPNNKRKFFKSAMILRCLSRNDYELIYFDEFSI